MIRLTVRYPNDILKTWELSDWDHARDTYEILGVTFEATAYDLRDIYEGGDGTLVEEIWRDQFNNAITVTFEERPDDEFTYGYPRGPLTAFSTLPSVPA